MTDKKSGQDDSIARLFDDMYSSKPEPPNFDNFDPSAKLQIKHIIDNKAKTVLEVGMGAGGMLLILQERGVELVYGVELSHEGIELAQKRFELFGDIERAVFYEGSFLDYKPPKVDAVSFHQVLHCHPDLEGMVYKSLEASPKMIINTMPRKTWYTTVFFNLMSLFKFATKGFRPFSHSPKKVEAILREYNYTKIFTEKSGIWETSLYKLE